jgi:glutaredoxin
MVERILDDLKIPYDLIDVTEKPEYLEKYPIFTVPSVVIDEKLEFIGVSLKQKLAEKIEDVKNG